MSLRRASCVARAVTGATPGWQKPGTVILDTWRKEMSVARWLKQGPGLYPAIGFRPEKR